MKVFGEFINVDGRDNDYIRRRTIYWARLRAVREDYIKAKPEFKLGEFMTYMEETYGVRMLLDGDMITPDHKVIDEAKFTFLLLKYE
jgi:hypothetical protein